MKQKFYIQNPVDNHPYSFLIQDNNSKVKEIKNVGGTNEIGTWSVKDNTLYYTTPTFVVNPELIALTIEIIKQ